jgi:hypothetical protein
VAGRANEETYPAFLQAKLRARFPRLDLEVLNLGVSGMTTEHWQWRLGEVLSYEPDVVIQYQAANDISWRHLPRYAKDHPLRGWLYRSPLHQRLFPFPVEALDPYLEETFDTLGVIAGACRERGISYLASSFAAPDPKRMSGDLRRHLDHNMEYWTRRFPLHSYETWAAIVARHNRLFVDFAHRQHVVHVLPHETLDEPTLFIDVCHFTPEGIERLADVFLLTVAGLVEATPAHALWAGRSSECLREGVQVPRMVTQVPASDEEKRYDENGGGHLSHRARQPPRGSAPQGGGEDQQDRQRRQPIAVKAVDGHVHQHVVEQEQEEKSLRAP